MTKLDPVDLDRCQATWTQRTPFALGGTHRSGRCEGLPSVVAAERVARRDGMRGAMSLCPECVPRLLAQLGADYATLEPILRREWQRRVYAAPTGRVLQVMTRHHPLETVLGNRQDAEQWSVARLALDELGRFVALTHTVHISEVVAWCDVLPNEEKA